MRRVEDIFGSFQIAPRQTPWTYIAQGGEQRITVPFSFVSCLLSIDGAVQIPGISYSVDGQDIIFSDDTVEKHLNPNQQLYFLFDTAWGDIGSGGGGGGGGNNGVMVERKFTTTGGETVLDPKITFSSVLLFVDGEAKYPGEYFTISGNKLVYTDPMTAGRDVYALFGIPSSSMSLYATIEQLTQVDGKVDLNSQNLASPVGQKYIGQVVDVSSLRTQEPTVTGQTIRLRGVSSGSINGGGMYQYDANSTLPDDGYSVIVTAGGKRWVRQMQDKEFLYPEDYGYSATDWSTAINAALSAAATLGKSVKLKTGRTYPTLGTVVFPANFNGNTFDLNGATIQANHYEAVIGSVVNGVVRNGTIRGIGSVDSRWNTTKNNTGIIVGDSSVIDKLNFFDLGNDAVSIPGNRVSVGTFYCDNIRDNPIAMYGDMIYVNTVRVGHCAGDGALFKSSNSRIDNYIGDMVGVPGSDPEPGFWAGGGIIFGSQDDVGDALGTGNSVGYVKIRQYGALGIGMNGVGCSVERAKLGSAYYTGANETNVRGGKVFAVLMHGNDNHIGWVKSDASPYGIGFTSGKGHSVGYAEINGTLFQQVYMTANINQLSVTTLKFDSMKVAGGADTNFIQAVNSRVGTMAFYQADVEVGKTSLSLKSGSMQIKDLLVECVPTGGGGTYVEITAATQVDNMVVNNTNGLALWVQPNGLRPSMATLSNMATATRPLYQIERSCILCGWNVNNRSTIGGQPTFYKSGATAVTAMFSGYSGTKPLGQGGATLNETVFNNFSS